MNEEVKKNIHHKILGGIDIKKKLKMYNTKNKPNLKAIFVNNKKKIAMK